MPLRARIRPLALCALLLPAAAVVPLFETAELIKWGPVPEGTPQGARQHDYDRTHQSIRVRFDRQGAAFDHAALGDDQMTA